VEKFLLWSFLVKEADPTGFRKQDILDYIDFCRAPPSSWLCRSNQAKFLQKNGFYRSNPEWSPFRLSSSVKAEEDPGKQWYRPAQQSLQATFTGLIAFYRYLMDEEICLGNPAQLAKKDCRHLIKDTQVRQVSRLTEKEWKFLLKIATAMADEDSECERNLFLVAALKTLFLRISELSERKDWTPMMSHFWTDTEDNWWLTVYGKGRKVRDVTVPSSFLVYLKRYRLHRGLSAFPRSGETAPIIEKLRGRGGLTSRQLSRLVQEVFDKAYTPILAAEGELKARKFWEASTHWLRHTGASLEIERGRALKDVSEDLGHSSMATTDTIYVHTEDKKRAKSGKQRLVE
jgi:site-specific recombinase XerD